ncbi:ATP-grasp domain-containing protein [Actinoplanes sp. NPDC049599]|uniref:ATP-grasp domain-containing protein n=1 Tax=Actinoplanes sp. NPDC049599 TaxID=3363903 RepID=UPI0037B9F562
MPARGRPPAVLVFGVMLGYRYPTLVPAARRRGLTVLGIDNLNPRNASIDAVRRRDPDHCLAGIAEVAWIPDHRGQDIGDRVAAWSRDHDIRAVLVLGEPYVDVAATMTDLLGLRGPGLRASRVCRNKLLQRRYLAAWSPPSRLVPAEARAAALTDWTTFPAVVKPIGRTASSGVRQVHSTEDLRAALDEYAPIEPAVVEQYVPGPELSVESLVAGHTVVFAEITGKRTNEDDGVHCVETGHTTPDPRLTPAVRAAVLAANAAVLDRLDFADGAAHAEFRVSPRGTITLMEVAARPAGDAIDTLYHLATGVPLVETLLAILLGEPARHPGPYRHARQVYLPHAPGILRAVHADGLGVPVSGLDNRPAWPAVTPLPAGAPPTVHYVLAGRVPGTRLQPVRESADRSTMVILDAPDAAGLDRLERRCHETIRIEVVPDQPATLRQVATVTTEGG